MVISLFQAVGPIVQQYERMFTMLVSAFESQQPTPSSISDASQASFEQTSPAQTDQTTRPNMGFDMEMTFDPNTFPDLSESGLLDGASNILSPTYWMEGGPGQSSRSIGSAMSGGSML